MKIVFLSDDFPPQSFGGAGISTYDLALGVKRAGHDVSVITTCRKESEAGQSDYSGLRVYRIANSYPGKWRWYLSLYNPKTVKKVEEILKEIQPDVVHINNIHFYLSYHSFKLAKKYSKSVVFTARDVMSFNFAKLTTKKYLENFEYKTTWIDHIQQAKKRWNPLRNFFIKRYLKYADKKFAVSKALSDAMDKNGIHNVGVLHTGADLSEWQVSEQAVADFKKKYHLENKKVVLFGGRLSEAKGGKEVIDVMVEVKKSFPDTVLLIAANETLQNTQGVDVVSAGWISREDMKAAYASADIVLMPSVCFDSFPRVILEGMASGRAVLGTCYGGGPEIIENGKSGYVINPFKTKDVAGKMIELLGDDQKRESFGKAARERVRTDFNLDDKVKMLVKTYTDLLHKHDQ